MSILIIFLFLRDGWSTFVISLSLPVSIIATFFIMGQLGLSLNVMSLGGLALATGLVAVSYTHLDVYKRQQQDIGIQLRIVVEVISGVCIELHTFIAVLQRAVTGRAHRTAVFGITKTRTSLQIRCVSETGCREHGCDLGSR